MAHHDRPEANIEIQVPKDYWERIQDLISRVYSHTKGISLGSPVIVMGDLILGDSMRNSQRIETKGAVVASQGSTWTNVENNLANTYASGPAGDELKAAISALREKLDIARDKNAESVSEIEEKVEDLTRKIAKTPSEKKKTWIDISVKGLMETAKAVGDIVPGLIAAATKVAEVVARLAA